VLILKRYFKKTTKRLNKLSLCVNFKVNGGAVLKYYEELSKLQCFSKSDVVRLTGNKLAAKNLIANYKRKGYIESVKRNLYVTISFETNQPGANRYKIASSITKGAYVSHHTAFEYYGCANQVYYKVYTSGKKRFAEFEYDDITYAYIAPRIDVGVSIKEDDIRITSMERTIVDSINDFEKIAGIEELLRCLNLVPYANEDKLLYFLRQYNKQFLYQKTGYILEHYKEQLRLSDNFFLKCKENKKNSVRYLYNGLEHSSHVYKKDWKLVVPVDLMKMITKGGMYDATV